MLNFIVKFEEDVCVKLVYNGAGLKVRPNSMSTPEKPTSNRVKPRGGRSSCLV